MFEGGKLQGEKSDRMNHIDITQQFTGVLSIAELLPKPKSIVHTLYSLQYLNSNAQDFFSTTKTRLTQYTYVI